MVDFDNDSTVGTPAIDVQRITILQRRYDLFEAVEDYTKRTLMSGPYPFAIIRARLLIFYLELEPMLKRHTKKNEDKIILSQIRDICFGETEKDIKEKDLFKAIIFLNKFLDSPLRLTRLDTRQQYNPQEMESENEAKGY